MNSDKEKRKASLEFELNNTIPELKKLGLRSSKFQNMLIEKGGYETALSLLADSKTHSGFLELFEKNRTDLSVESIALNYPDILPEDCINVAKRRLGIR